MDVAAVQSLPRALDGEDELIAREALKVGQLSGFKRVGEVVMAIDAMSDEQRRYALDRLRRAAGLKSATAVDRERRFKATNRAWRQRPRLHPRPKSNRPKTVTLIPTARAALEQLLELPGYYPTGVVFPNKTGGRLTAPTMSAYWKEVRARAGVDVEFYVATKHYGVWYLKVREGLDNGAIGAQAGWSEKTVDDMVKTYSHSADERRLDDIDAHFAGKRDADRDATAAQPR